MLEWLGLLGIFSRSVPTLPIFYRSPILRASAAIGSKSAPACVVQSLFGREVDVTESAPLGEDSTALDSDSNGNSQRAVGLYVGLGILIAFVCGGAPVLSWWCCKAACVRRTQDINRFNSTDPTVWLSSRLGSHAVLAKSVIYCERYDFFVMLLVVYQSIILLLFCKFSFVLFPP